MTASDITNLKMEKDIRKWFWGFFLGQAMIFGFWAIWFSAVINTKVSKHEGELQEIRNDIKTKSDRDAVVQLKIDLERQNNVILEELKYIRQRIDKQHP